MPPAAAAFLHFPLLDLDFIQAARRVSNGTGHRLFDLRFATNSHQPHGYTANWNSWRVLDYFVFPEDFESLEERPQASEEADRQPKSGIRGHGNYPRNATGGLKRGQDRRDFSVVRRRLGQSAGNGLAQAGDRTRAIRTRDYLASTLRLIFTLGRLSN
jgi:hypothetical protein